MLINVQIEIARNKLQVCNRFWQVADNITFYTDYTSFNPLHKYHRTLQLILNLITIWSPSVTIS
jgi:hypothetical protein